MSQENREIVLSFLAVVIVACLLQVVVVGGAWDDTTADTTAHPVSELTAADAAPATKSCGDFPLHLPDVPWPLSIKVEVLEGDIPCPVAQRVIEDRYREHPLWQVDDATGVTTGSWRCHGVRLTITRGITICEKNRGRQGTIRGRLPCRDWGPRRPSCLNTFKRGDSASKSLSLYEYMKSLGPSLYWPLDATYGATDQSGNSRNGTGQGGISIGAFADGPLPVMKTSTEFDGSNDRISSTYNPFVTSSTRTFTGWAYRDASATGDALIGGDGANPPLLQLGTGDQDVEWYPDGARNVTSALTWPGNGQWVHWALVFDESEATSNATFYVNGISAGTQDAAQNYHTNHGNFSLAAVNRGGEWDGKMAHVAVFERALTATEIQKLASYSTSQETPGSSGAGLPLRRRAANRDREPGKLPRPRHRRATSKDSDGFPNPPYPSMRLDQPVGSTLSNS